ncbi:MAG: hypothetical protein R2844_17280 [Caldilineales bacterium]
MLVAPDLPRAAIADCLRDRWRLEAQEIVFLPLGADVNTAVFRVAGSDGRAYFLKLRAGPFDDTALTLARFLADQGVDVIIPPLTAASGEVFAPLDRFTAVLYPFISGVNGYQQTLSERQWRDFGAATPHPR